jgi:hypothetical protein
MSMDLAGTLQKVKQQRGMWGSNLCAAAVNVEVTGTGNGSASSAPFALGGSFIQKPSMSVGHAVCTDASGNAVFLHVAIKEWYGDSSTGGISGAVVDVTPIGCTPVAYTANVYLNFVGNGLSSSATCSGSTVAP